MVKAGEVRFYAAGGMGGPALGAAGTGTGGGAPSGMTPPSGMGGGAPPEASGRGGGSSGTTSAIASWAAQHGTVVRTSLTGGVTVYDLSAPARG